MQSGELVELAAILATHGESIVRCEARLTERSLQDYWNSSRCRMERWSQCLHRYTVFTERQVQPLLPHDSIWTHIRATLEEIFTAEIITRVWAAIAVAYDARRDSSEIESMARSILISHVEIRHRALRLLIDPMAMHPTEAEWLNQLRKRCDRWTDLLIGRLMARQLGDLAGLACDADRANDFAKDLRRDQAANADTTAWPLMLDSLRSAFQRTKETVSPNADLNSAIAVSLLASFPADMFDSTGLVGSLWQIRLTHLIDDVEQMIDRIASEAN